MFRSRLYHIENEKELFEYFKKHASYLEQYDTYTCAGVCANDTAELFQKLKEEWKQDTVNRIKEILIDSA